MTDHATRAAQLIAKAASTESAEEAQTCVRIAHRLMAEHRLTLSGGRSAAGGWPADMADVYDDTDAIFKYAEQLRRERAQRPSPRPEETPPPVAAPPNGMWRVATNNAPRRCEGCGRRITMGERFYVTVEPAQWWCADH